MQASSFAHIDPVAQSERMLEAYKNCLKQYTDEELEKEMEYQFRHGAELIPMLLMLDTQQQHRNDLNLVVDYLQAIREEMERRSC